MNISKIIIESNKVSKARKQDDITTNKSTEAEIDSDKNRDEPDLEKNNFRDRKSSISKFFGKIFNKKEKSNHSNVGNYLANLATGFSILSDVSLDQKETPETYLNCLINDLNSKSDINFDTDDLIKIILTNGHHVSEGLKQDILYSKELFDQNKLSECSEILKSILVKIPHLDQAYKTKSNAESLPDCIEKNLMFLIYDVLNPGSSLDTESLLEKMIREGHPVTENIKQDFSNAQMLFNLYDSYECSKILRSVLKRLCLIDVQLIQNLVEINDQTLNMIKNENIFILFGTADSGKMELLNYLSGSKFEKNEHLTNLNYETTQVVPIQIDLANGENIVLCDSPGFEEKNLIEIEIAKKINLKRAIDLCSGVKPLVVLSQNSNPLMLSQALFDILPEERTISNYVKYLANDPEEKIYSQFMVETSDQSLNFISNDILNKKYINFNFSSLGSKKEIIREIMNDDFINEPNRHFRISFDFESKQACEKHLEYCFNIIEKCLIANNNELAVHKVQEVVQLSNYIKCDSVQKRLMGCWDTVVSNLIKELDKMCSKLVTKLEKNTQIENEDVKDYSKSMELAQQIETLCKDLYKFQYYESQFLRLYNDLIKRSELVKNNLQKKSILADKTSILIDLNNLLQIQNHFESNYSGDISQTLMLIYTQSCEIVKKLITQIADDNDEIKSVLDATEQMSSFIDIFKQHSKIDFSALSNQMEEKLSRMVAKRLDESKKLLSDNSNDSFELLKKIDSELQMIKKQEVYNSFISQIRLFFDGLKINVMDAIESEQFDSIENVLKLFIRFNEYFSFSQAIGTSFNEINNEIKSKIDSYQSKIIELMNKKFDLNDLSCVDKVINYLMCLNGLKWYDSIKPNYISKSLTLCRSAIRDKILHLINILPTIKINVEIYENLALFDEIIFMLENYSKFYKNNLGFSNEQSFLEAKKSFVERLDAVFTEIDRDLENSKYKDLDVSVKFLSMFEKSLNYDVWDYRSKIFQYKEKIEDFINKKYRLLLDVFDEELDQVLVNNLDTKKSVSALREIQVINSYENLRGFLSNEQGLEYQDKLTNLLELFEEKILSNDYSDEEKVLNQLSVLRSFDSYVKNLGKNTFTSLYRELIKNLKMQKEKEDLFGSCVKQIDSNQYKELLGSLDFFKEDKQKIGLLRSKVVFSLTKLYGDLCEIFKEYEQKNYDFINTKKIFEINSSIKQANCLKEFIDEDASESKRVSLAKHQAMSDFESFLNNLEHYLSSRTVKEAYLVETIKKSIKELVFLNEIFDTDLIYLRLKNFEPSISIEVKLDNFNDLKGLDLTRNYQVLNNNDCFKTAKDDLIEKIKDLFKSELGKVSMSSIGSDEQLDLCKKMAQRHLPADIQVDYIEPMIKKREQEIKTNLLAEQLSGLKGHIDVEKLAESFESLKRQGDDENLAKVKKILIEQIRLICKQAQSDYENDDFKQVVENYNSKFLLVYTKFCDLIPELKGFQDQYFEIVRKIQNSLEQKFKPLFRDFISQELSQDYVKKLENGNLQRFNEIDFEIKSNVHEYVIQHLINIYKIYFDLTSIVASDELKIFLANHLNSDNFEKAIINDPKLDSYLNELKSLFSDSSKLGEFKVLNDFNRPSIELIKKNFKLVLFNSRLVEIDRSFKHLDSIEIIHKIKLFVGNFSNVFSKIEFFSKSTNRFKSEYDQFFQILFSNLDLLKELSDLAIETNFDKIINVLSTKIDNLFSELLEYMESSSQTPEDFLNSYYNLISFKDKSSQFKLGLNLKQNFHNSLLTQIIKKLNSFVKNLTSDPSQAAKLLSDCKKLSIDYFVFKKEIDEQIDVVLDEYIRNNGGFKLIGVLAVHLISQKHGSLIVSEHKIFESYQRSLFMTKTQHRDIEKVIKEMQKKNQDIDGVKLKKFFDKYQLTFEGLVKNNLGSLNLSSVISNVKMMSQKIKIENQEWRGESDLFAELTANLFALWTLLNSSDFLKINNSVSSECLFQAHPAQILSIARMLGFGYTNKSNSISNCLIQIGTGEGKSITLAITAAILSLLGFEVFCVCYSKYLSDRDFNTFKDLFDRLQLSESIRYGTFYEICESVINQNGDLRDLIREFIIDKSLSLSKNIKNENPKILLIDEVDVFFSKDFYGNDYKPCLNLTDETVTNLIDYIWASRTVRLDLNLVKSSIQYKNVCEKLGKDWIPIIDSNVQLMLSDLETFEKHDYVCQDGRIGYVDQDSVSFNINYGYKTMFAYYLESEKDGESISKAAFNRTKSILIKIGSFSLAEIPKLMFKNILGVTGTLETLNRRQREIIENEYNMRYSTIIPSIYGESKLSFDPKLNVSISNEENYYSKLVDEIGSRIRGKDGEKRAVFVFFENKKELKLFLQCDRFAPWTHKTKILTEDANFNEKQNIVNNAAQSDRVTLFTKAFGRGTDFKVFDEIVRKSGVHVIQTFLSDELSEEIQIKGRTARQGDEGSFSIVLLDSKIEKYQVDWTKLSKEEYYVSLNAARNILFEDSYLQTIEFVKKLKLKHDETIGLMNYLRDNDFENVKNYLLSLNKITGGGSIAKTLILIDGTGSMSKLLENVKNTLGTIFDRAFSILKEKNANATFLIKLVIYRNYSSTFDLLLQNSSWENQADNLVKFLRGVYTSGGMGNEAIEMGLWQANQEENLSQIIIIGDMPANNQQEVLERKSYYARNFRGTRYEHVWTFYEDELIKLIEKNVKVNGFYLKENAKQNFSDMARMTNGKCEYLDLNSFDSSQVLIDLVTSQVLFSIGGDSLVQAYRTAKW